MQTKSNAKFYSKINQIQIKGAHSPDMRVLSMGVYPIQKLNSQVVGQDDVSNERMRTLMTMPTKKNAIPTSTTTTPKT